jgi:hypothetical protein
VRTYLTEQKNNFKQIAFFCTMGGSGDKKAFAEMEKIIGKKPASALALTTREVTGGEFGEKAEKFLSEISPRS